MKKVKQEHVLELHCINDMIDFSEMKLSSKPGIIFSQFRAVHNIVNTHSVHFKI